MEKLDYRLIKLGILNKIIRNLFTLQRKIGMLKKAIAILSFAFFAVPNVLPFVTADECNLMSSLLQTISDEVAPEKECPPTTIRECNTAIYLPIITAPFSKFKVQSDFSQAVAQNLERVHPTRILRGLSLLHLPLPAPPPAHQTPLLI